jgi:hypothetical protein
MPSTPDLAPLLTRAQVISWRYGIEDHAGESMASGALGFIEHTMHELAHGLLLKLPLPQGRPRWSWSVLVGYELRGDRGRQYLRAVRHESRALSIEWAAIQQLALPLEAVDVATAAEGQGVTDIKRLFRESRKPEHLRHAATIVAMLTGTAAGSWQPPSIVYSPA